ncbi:MAG: hypothetical protein DIU79_08005 [Actinobacteria bacterium]|nr:MAG: hypothetical protein DIU79_08005 [Actinomycetota bacterium]
MVRRFSNEQELDRRLDRPMSVLGLIFLLVILAEPLTDDRALSLTLSIASWLLWSVFVAEFAVRLTVAEDRKAFLRRHWWQIPLLAMPFLRLFRVLFAFRVGALGRLAFAFVHGTNPAARLLSARLAWLITLTLLVILAASHALYRSGAYHSYAKALHDSAVSTIAGQPLSVRDGVAGVIELILATYSVIVFATLAGTLGAYFLGEHKKPDRDDR